MEIMENADEDGELLINNVMLDHGAELGIPNILKPDDDKKNNAAMDTDTDEDQEQAEVEPTKYTPKESRKLS